MINNFKTSLTAGKIGEKIVTDYFTNKGYTVIDNTGDIHKEFDLDVYTCPNKDGYIFEDTIEVKNQKCAADGLMCLELKDSINKRHNGQG